MDQAYVQSVKFPNLLPVKHPITKFQKGELNIEGFNNNSNNNGTLLSAKRNIITSKSVSNEYDNKFDNNNNNNRTVLISSLIDLDENKKRQDIRNSKVNFDTVMEKINEKLTTGYHGVKHLFKSNNPNKQGVLTKEGFKHVLNILCGYIPTDEWLKVIKKFELDKNETISFEEFISHFYSNEKVRKEIINDNRQLKMLNLNYTSILNQNDDIKQDSSSDLSAVYCFALIKAKARSHIFDPSKIIPSECLQENSLILPHHLDIILDNLNLSLSDSEFRKLWKKLDTENIGGIKVKVFLRLINYNPNQIDEISHSMDKLRTKSCIGNLMKKTENDPGKKSMKNSYIMKITPRSAPQTKTGEQNKNLNESTKCENESQEIDKKTEVKLSGKNINTVTENSIQIEEQESDKNDSKTLTTNSQIRVETSASEIKTRNMVQRFKKSLDFKLNDDLILFFNNKLNAGYISLRTAFEYIDPDNLGFLLKDEFLAVLREFEINFKNNEFEAFLRNHSLIKRNELVNYHLFLKIFQDKSKTSISQKILDEMANIVLNESDGLTSKEADFKLANFLHNFYLSALNFFRESNKNSLVCSKELFKNLLEQKFLIKIDEKQMKALFKFLNHDDNQAQILWPEFFKKFAELDPWCYFKERQEKNVNINTNSTNIKSKIASSYTNIKPLINMSSVFNDRSFGITKDSPEIDETTTIKAKYIEYNNQKIDNKIRSMNNGRSEPNLAACTVRSLQELESTIHDLLNKKIHTINKNFALLDSKGTKLLDKEKFSTLMNKCSIIDINKEEIDLLWRDFNSDNVPFSNFLKRFISPREFDKYRVKERSNLGNTRFLTNYFKIDESNCDPTNEDTNTFKKNENLKKEILDKIQPFVIKNWLILKKEFQDSDLSAYGYTSNEKAIKIINKIMNKSKLIQLNQQEFDKVCSIFRIDDTSSKFDYYKFLNCFRIDKQHLTMSQNKNITKPHISDSNLLCEKLIKRLREMSKEKKSGNNSLWGDVKILRSTFRKFDKLSKGYLTVDEFKELLKYCGFDATSEDLYQLSREFDPQLKGVFQCDLFIKILIDKTI